MSFQIRCVAVLSIVALMASAGCGGGAEDQPEVVPVSGAVLYNGDPVSGATVSFWADGAPREASGVTDAEGRFELSMFAVNDGAIPGENVITVTKVEGTAPPSNTPTGSGPPENPTDMSDYLSRMGQRPGEGQIATEPTSLIPDRYGNQATTPLKETVVAGGTNNFVLQLTD